MPTYGFKSEDIVNSNRITQEEIDEIKEWALTQKVPRLNDEQVVNFVLSCERNIDLAKNTVIEFYKTRKDYKELFNNRDLDDDDIKSQLEALEYIYLPKRTKAGEALIYHKLSDTTYWKYKMSPSMKLLFMTIDAAVYQSPPTGLIILFDMKGVSLMHLTRIKVGIIKAFSQYTQDALPAKLIAIHVLNTQYFINKIMAFFKPFLKPHIYNLLHFHPPTLNLEDFHKNFVDKDCLPADLGGTLKPTAELHQDNIKLLRNMKQFFDEEENERNEFFDTK
nr:alpha-tocopherol transfer protein-like [Onthophagus taurus]